VIEPLPPGFAATRAALHAVAEQRVSPPRAEVTGRIDLRATAGGFGTPVFDGDREVRVDGAALVVIGRGEETREPLDGVDEVAARWLGRFFALALHTLTELARDMPREWAPSPPKIWPEHFDYALVAGAVRSNYGFSPGGDEVADEPYLYVGRWEPAGLETVRLGDVADPLAWLRERAAALHA
jgi:hypothetical protein